MLKEGLTIIMEYREGKELYTIKNEFLPHMIEMANKEFMYMLGETTEHMWHKMEKELFARE